MVIAMNGIEKQAAYYRGYLTDDRALAPVVGILMTAIALWLLVYLVSLVGPAPGAQAGRPEATASHVVAQPAAR